ncbi:MAG: DUF6377 domain-containing protein [Parafilimonas sp.]
MKKCIALFIFLLCLSASCFAASDSLLIALKKAINEEPKYDALKKKEINQLKQTLNAKHFAPPAVLFNLNEQLYEAYKVFNYDSAYLYAGKMLQIAKAENAEDLVRISKLKFAFIMLSSGLYRETFDTLQSINVTNKPDSIKAEYYTLLGRYYYDLAYYDFDNYHSVDYDITGSKYIDSALSYYPDDSFEKNYYSGLRFFKKDSLDKATVFFEKLMEDKRLSEHEIALTSSTLSGICLQKNQPQKAIDLLIIAAIADIHSSTKEVLAILNLAEMLYQNGDVENASMFIEKAIQYADFYGARQRKVQVSAILPLIDNEKIRSTEAERKFAIQYGIAVTLFVIVLAVLIVVIRKQVKKLQAAKQVITEANIMQRHINEKLEEANKIKEEYIGYFFKLDSEYFARLDKLKRTIEKKLADKKTDEIRFILNNIQLKKEKEELLHNFDKVFLRIFPNFITAYNALFKEEDKIKLTENEYLNTDMRIFALIRIGISENEKIAEILEYSVNTIYAYKTKIKNKSIVSNDDFEKKIMEIRSV